MKSITQIKREKKEANKTPEGTVIEGVKLYTFEDAAKVMGISQRTVQTYYGDKKLKGRKLGRRIYILADSIKEYLQGDAGDPFRK